MFQFGGDLVSSKPAELPKITPEAKAEKERARRKAQGLDVAPPTFLWIQRQEGILDELKQMKTDMARGQLRYKLAADHVAGIGIISQELRADLKAEYAKAGPELDKVIAAFEAKIADAKSKCEDFQMTLERKIADLRCAVETRDKSSAGKVLSRLSDEERALPEVVALLSGAGWLEVN